MAAGESIKEITQKVTFYNTAGLIERDKQIYYVPLTNDMIQTDETVVSKAYKKLFDTVCPPPNSNYVEIGISRWNPEDRVLRVNGDSDLFRRGSSTTALNYMVLERHVVEKNTEGTIVKKETFYYGYFISKVRQAGVNSVELTLEPDFWTNVFYWSNNNTFDSTFKPFEKLISNPFVERQHYNRVKVKESYSIVDDGVYGETEDLKLQKEYILSKMAIDELNQSSDGVTRISYYGRRLTGYIYFDDLIVEKRNRDNEVVDSFTGCSLEVDIDNHNINIYHKGTNPQLKVLEETISFVDYMNNVTWWYSIKLTTNEYLRYTKSDTTYYVYDFLLVPESISQLKDFDNMDLFIKTEESYNYRQMFKDLRVPLTFDTYETRNGRDNVLNKIPESAYNVKTPEEARTYLHNLCSGDNPDYETADAICRSCINYLHVVTKERLTYPTVIKASILESGSLHDIYYQSWYNKDYEIDKNFPSATQHLVIPFITECKGLEAFARYLNGEWIPAGTSEVVHGIIIRGKYKQFLIRAEAGNNNLTYYDSTDFSEFISNMNEKYGYYIQSMFVTPYCELSPSYDYEQDGVIFNGDIVNENINPTTPLVRRQRRGTWWSGYSYRKIYSPTKLISDYDDAVVSKPTLVMLPLEKVELNANQSELASLPHSVFKLLGTVDSPTGCEYNAHTVGSDTVRYFDEDIMGYAFLVGTKGFEYNTSNGRKYQQVLHLDYSLEKQNLTNQFYEPVLEMEPYSFYSISMSEVESPIERKRYYQMNLSPTHTYYDDMKVTYRIPLFYNQSINTMFKMGVIPEYTIDGVSQRYYSEALLFTTTSGVTVHVDSYAEFMYVMSPQLKAQSHLAVYNAQMDMEKALISAVGSIGAGAMSGGGAGAGGGAISGITSVINQQITNEQNIHNTMVNLKAQKASAGQKADTFQQAGSDYIYELNLDENFVMLNHYRIDERSYNSISKMLERYGYYVNLYDELNWDNRVGYNFIKLVHFDFDETNITLSEEQMFAIDSIFKTGVTLLHQRGYLETSYHNYETILDLIE